MSLRTLLQSSPVIAAVRREPDMEAAVAAPVGAIFLLCGDINSLGALVSRGRAAGKMVFAHVDLIPGLASDHAAVEFLARQIKPDGLLSTRGQVVRSAVELGLIGIQRLFVMDSSALQTGTKQVKSNRPHAVELMPATLPAWVFQAIRADLDMPLVVGGLLRTKADIVEALRRGADGVSASRPDLWTA